MTKNLDMICALITETKPNISNLVLQKLLYFIQASLLVTTGKPAFEEEIEAWMYGPVVPEVYDNFKKDKNYYKNIDTSSLDLRTQGIVRKITEDLGKLNPYALVNLTHEYATWKDSWEMDGWNTVISKNEIKEYHKKRLREKGSYF